MSVFLHPRGRPFFCGTYFPPTSRHGQPGFGEILDLGRRRLGHRRDDVLAAGRAADRGRPRRGDSPRHARAATGAPRGSRERLVAARRRARPARLRRPSTVASGAAPKFPHPACDRGVPRPRCRDRRRAGGRWPRPRSTRWRAAGCSTTSQAASPATASTPTWYGAALREDAERPGPPRTRLPPEQRRGSTATPTRGSRGGRSTSCSTSMRVPGGFASAIDADAGGVEGAHVVLTATEVRDVRSTRPGLAARSAATHRALLARRRRARRWRVGAAPRARADLVGDDDDEARARRARRAALTHPHPAIDDKVLLEWNAMLASVLAEAAWRLDEPRYGTAASPLVASLALDAPRCAAVARRSGARRAARDERATWPGSSTRTSRCSSSTATPRTSRPRRRRLDDLVGLLGRRASRRREQPDVGRGLFQCARRGQRAPRAREGRARRRDAVGLLGRGRRARATRHAHGSDDRCPAVAERLVSLGRPLLDAQAPGRRDTRRGGLAPRRGRRGRGPRSLLRAPRRGPPRTRRRRRCSAWRTGPRRCSTDVRPGTRSTSAARRSCDLPARRRR